MATTAKTSKSTGTGTARKPAARKPAAKPAAGKARAVRPEATTEDTPVVVSVPTAGGVLKKKELIDRVVAASGAKKKVAKQVVEATLEALGAALAAGENLQLPPFGKARTTRQKEAPEGGATMVVKVRRGGARKAPVTAPVAEAAPAVTEPLAEPVE